MMLTYLQEYGTNFTVSINESFVQITLLKHVHFETRANHEPSIPQDKIRTQC